MDLRPPWSTERAECDNLSLPSPLDLATMTPYRLMGSGAGVYLEIPAEDNSDRAAVPSEERHWSVEMQIGSPAEGKKMASEPSIESARRNCVAAAAMAYAPATDVPRERALLQSAVSSLIGAFGESVFDRQSAIEEISRHGALPELRASVAEDLFNSLCYSRVLRESEENPGTYSLAEGIAEETRRTTARVDALIDKVVEDLFHDLALSAQAKVQLRDRLMVCLASTMAEYGRQYAYQVAGRSDNPINVDRDDLTALCDRALSDEALADVPPVRMAEAIAELFAQREPDFARFVFSLTQNFYYLRLLGLEGGLEFLSEDRFSGSHLFLDTNVLIAFLFPESRHHRSILELGELALRLEISLHMTEITLSELDGVMQYGRTDLAKVFDEVPDGLVDSTRGVFLRAYRQRKTEDPSLTVQTFFDSIVGYRSVFEDDWGITVLDDRVEEQIDKGIWTRTKKILRRHSCRTRKVPKPAKALEHDTHMYFVVMNQRSVHDEKAWLLTLDTSLPRAAVELQPRGDLSFCMTLDGFLQIMSPYVRADHQQSFAEMFVELVGRNLFPPEHIIHLDDFRMFTDFDLSVRKLPPADVRKVMRSVKRAAGGGIGGADRRMIAYEVQKALSDPTLTYRGELEDQIKKLEKGLAHREETLEQKAGLLETQAAQHGSEMASLEHRLTNEISELSEGIRQQQRNAEALKLAHEKLRKKEAKLAFCLRTVFATIVLGPLTVGLWFAPESWTGLFKHPMVVQIGVTIASASIWLGVMLKQKVATIITVVTGVVGTALAVVGGLK